MQMLKKYSPHILSTLCFFFVLLLTEYIYYPWIDEIGTADTPINFVLRNSWHSNIWPYSYHPLHAFLQIVWLTVFGVSHLSVCGFNAFLALIASYIIIKYIPRIFIHNSISCYCFIILFWGYSAFHFGGHYGRIDYLIMIFTILLVNAIINYHEDNNKQVGIYSILLMLSGVYSIPLVLFLYTYLYITKKEKRIIKDSVISIICFGLIFCLICIFYYYNGVFFRFVHTYFSFNGNLNSSGHRLAAYCDAYSNDCITVLTLLIGCIYAKIKCLNLSYKYFLFILAIPAIMVLAGRYAVHYRWLFDIPAILTILYIFKSRKIYTLIITILLIVSICWETFCPTNKIEANYKQKDRCEKFVEQNYNYIEKNTNVVILDGMFYYPLVIKCDHLWAKLNGVFQIDKSPKEKMQEMVERFIHNKKIAKSLMDFYLLHEKEFIYMPEKGALFSANENQLLKATDYFKNNDYSYNIIKKENSCCLVFFQKE